MITRRLALTRGEWVLLYGASGGVGSLALQMAVAQGAHVIAVARAQRHSGAFRAKAVRDSRSTGV
jgi:NADPH:quinone reductase-like Zn-dependent oxidoreductase